MAKRPCPLRGMWYDYDPTLSGGPWPARTFASRQALTGKSRCTPASRDEDTSGFSVLLREDGRYMIETADLILVYWLSERERQP